MGKTKHFFWPLSCLDLVIDSDSQTVSVAAFGHDKKQFRFCLNLPNHVINGAERMEELT